MRIVHHRDPALRAVVIVVAETECMADFVGGQLTDALERGLVENRRPLAALAGRQQTFEDHVVLPIAQRPQRDGGLDDLTGPRIPRSSLPELQPRVDRCTQLIML